MKQLVNRFLGIFGWALYSNKAIRTYSPQKLKELYGIDEQAISYIKGKLGGGLKDKLITEGKTRWLDIGCGGNRENDFFYLDIFPEEKMGLKDKYFCADMTDLQESDLKKTGTFDLVRLQHVFEHFTPEDGQMVLANCAKLLNPEGYILISTPDLKKYIQWYLSGNIRENFDWALTRIDKDSPDSFYFSVFAHSVLHEQHKWCYDAEGLIYQLTKAGKFQNIRELKLMDELSSSPFTHNRPYEDVCVLAQLR